MNSFNNVDPQPVGAEPEGRSDLRAGKRTARTEADDAGVGELAVRAATVAGAQEVTTSSEPEHRHDAMPASPEEPGPEDFRSLGELLVYLRNRANERAAAENAPTLDAVSVKRALRAQGYKLPHKGYGVLEQDRELPAYPELFLNLICTVLGVGVDSKYRGLLVRQYLYDHARLYVGKDYADQNIPHGSAYLASVRVDHR